jgi:hypothetical protein
MLPLLLLVHLGGPICLAVQLVESIPHNANAAMQNLGFHRVFLAASKHKGRFARFEERMQLTRRILCVPSYGFTNVASMLELPPAVTVIVRCQGVISSFPIETWWSPGANWMVDGVLPMYFPSTFMSHPSIWAVTNRIAHSFIPNRPDHSLSAQNQGKRLFWSSQKRANSSNHLVVRLLKNSEPPPGISGVPTTNASARIIVPPTSCSSMIVLSVANPASCVCDRYRIRAGGAHFLMTYRPATTIG